jgi:hypothetical protein
MLPFWFSAGLLAWLACAPAALAAENPWNGWWKLDNSRKEPDGAADDYRFMISSDGVIRWEIPSLREVNTGVLNGRPFAINRPGVTPGMTLRVRGEGPRVLRYTVAKDGQPVGAGLMTLADDGQSWTDVPLDLRDGTPLPAMTMVYVRRKD